MPEPDDTVSVKVTEGPWVEGLGDEVRLEVVAMVSGVDHLGHHVRGGVK